MLKKHAVEGICCQIAIQIRIARVQVKTSVCVPTLWLRPSRKSIKQTENMQLYQALQDRPINLISVTARESYVDE